jgi:short-subunit dehydrogenase
MHVVITGASSGIGEALAREYHRAGAKLTLVARRAELLQALNQSLDGGAHLVVQDLSDTERATSWIAAAEAANGPIDVLINNAGVENSGPTLEASIPQGEALLRTNLHTPIRLMMAVLPGMKERKTGAIVNVASVAGIAALPGQAWYGASKAGIAMFSEVLRAEMVEYGIPVVTVYPGPVKTPMADAAYEVFGGRSGVARLAPEGTPEALAVLVRRAVERKKSRVVYPSFYGGARLFPTLARWFSDRFSPKPKSRT